jgi:hypothetical protein
VTPEDRQFLHQTSVRITSVNRAAVLYTCLLTGFWGGHKFFAGRTARGLDVSAAELDQYSAVGIAR